MKRFDKLSIGLVTGIVLPIICILVYYYIKFYPTYTLGEFLEYAQHNTPALTPFIAISLLINIVLFTLFINTNMYRLGKGIFWGTVIYGVTSFILKLLA